MTEKKSVLLNLTKEQVEQADREAQKLGITRTEYLRRTVDQKLFDKKINSSIPNTDLLNEKFSEKVIFSEPEHFSLAHVLVHLKRIEQLLVRDEHDEASPHRMLVSV